ncbi:ectonucleoside triphosphate diphosphohydrolase 3 isoform X2 [Thunnus maccoyii]|uniref:ectonucleoside triphosphate diphosphohydrolase 3 isoform X2 n=1 Tax=Thunnus maccoyii TaxID=8240 RepID=UPI001C4AE700|nr:ectonucleoside triphosphate diphosphohydrolase 3 isoform X2 [Thunnus maccoyii]
MASKRQICFKCRIAVVLLVLLAGIAALIAVAIIQDTWRSKEYSFQYGIVIDSGSSRSNVYLYEWPGEKENETGVVTEIMNCRVAGDGISEMKIDQEKDAASWKAFRACMENITKAIPPKKHKTTPLFLGATAGMRLLHEADEQRSNEILASLRDYLSSLPFIFQNASIITGQEEGLYGWITVNYLMGNFLEKNLWNTYVRPEGAKTVGSMDLGGASTQIAFAVQDDLMGPDYLHVKLYGYPYNVYTHSFLCYGKNEAEKRVLDKVVQAYAGFFYTARALLMNGTSDFDQFNTAVRKFCHTEWKQLVEEKTWISERFLRTYCYASHYVFTLLADGYKFDNETWKNINFQSQVKKTSIGWSLGYMLSMSNMIPSEVNEIPPMTDPVFAGLIFLFSAITIVTTVLVFIIIIRTCY